MNKTKPAASWFNYDAGEFDSISGLPDDLRPYVTNAVGGRALFDLLVETGSTQMEAFLHVMEVAAGKATGGE